MATKHLFFLLLQFIGWQSSCLAQRTPYSLQAAVDELHRREAAKYPLNAPPSQPHMGVVGSNVFLGGSPQEQDYWDDDSDTPVGSGTNNRNRHRLNKILAKYLERENYDADHSGLSLGPFGGYEFDEDNSNIFLNYPEEKKRASYFRERDVKFDNSPSTIFRERETQAPNTQDHAELTEQFLREIEESQELDREERYKEALRRLWEKYQQQENELDGNLFDEQKRMMASSTPNYYIGPLMQKKRSYPVLPWLPMAAARKKRFPVAKRSTKRSPAEGAANFGKTDEKVARELSELFGTPVEEKKKRSTDEQEKLSTTHAPTQIATATTTGATANGTTTKKGKIIRNLSNKKTKPTSTDLVGHENIAGHAGHVGYHGHSQNKHKHRKRSDGGHHAHDESHEEEEESEEHEEHDEHEEHEEDEHEEEEDEHEEFEEGDPEEERKKKRDISSGEKHSNWEIIKEDQILPGDIPRRKKSVDWSTYFGLDKKKKSVAKEESANMAVKKRSTNEDNDESGFDEKQRKREFDPEKLDNMDKKLQSIEDLIIDETIKYTGAHEGIDSPDEIRRLKDHVLSRLATAYSLEKMRRALERLRQSVDNENHLLRNVIENESKSDEIDALEAQKRLSVKKEKVQYDNNHLSPTIEKSKEIHSNAMMSSAGPSHDKHNDDIEDEEDMKKKKKKRTGYARYPELPNDFSDFEEELGAGHYESLNDAYLGNKNYILGTNQCPLIEAMAERCRGVDILSGDIHQELLPICGVHQICYLCGTSQVACDYQYLAEADSICGHNNDCQAAARSVLMILRGTPGPQLGPRECLKNSCLYSAMREIGL